MPAGTTSGETICLVDLLGILDADLPAGAGEDSYDVLPALRAEPAESIRKATVHHGCRGTLAIRKDEWVLIDGPTGDENGGKEPDWFRQERGYENHDQEGELYDLSADPAQRANRYADRPEKVTELRSLLEQ